MHILPTTTKGAAENMADDELLLNAYPHSEAPRFRHYGWEHSAWTFGYTQAYETVLRDLPSIPQELIRRPTAGGMVDHNNDWTYALVIPQCHQAAKLVPLQIYNDVHSLLRKSMESSAQVKLQIFQPEHPSHVRASTFAPVRGSLGERGKASADRGARHPQEESLPRAKQCFQAPSPYDVLLEDGKKLAGAALKRNKNGVLVQGTISRSVLPSLYDWEIFKTNFIKNLATYLVTEPQQVDFPKWDAKLYQETYQRYRSEQWNHKR